MFETSDFGERQWDLVTPREYEGTERDTPSHGFVDMS